MTASRFLESWTLLAAEGKAKSPLYVDVDLAWFTLVVFGILMFILLRYAWRPLMEGLDKREKSIADNIDQAAQANEKAQSLLSQYEQKIAAATEEANRMINDARQEAQAAKDRIVAAANEEASRQRERAIADINAAKDAAVRELARKSVDSAVSLAGNIVGKEIDSQTHAKLIEQSLDQFAN